MKGRVILNVDGRKKPFSWSMRAGPLPEMGSSGVSLKKGSSSSSPTNSEETDFSKPIVPLNGDHHAARGENRESGS